MDMAGCNPDDVYRPLPRIPLTCCSCCRSYFDKDERPTCWCFAIDRVGFAVLYPVTAWACLQLVWMLLKEFFKLF